MRVRQAVAGLLAFPLSVLPFIAYGTLTPEGRLVRDKVLVAISRPVLPTLALAQRKAAAIAAPRYEGAVMTLVYHGLGSSSDGEGGTVISPKRFAEHLATLKAAGMHAVTAADVADSFATGRPLPSNAVMITFDDGRTDAMLFADPLLEQARMKATMFVITGAAAKPGVYYASWNRLSDAAKSGRWDLQAHTDAFHVEHDIGGGRTLPALTSLAEGESVDEYRARVRRDLSKSSAALKEHTGRAPVAFAYPFGAYGADRTNSSAIRDVLREEIARRYVLAFHQDDQHTVPLTTPAQERTSLRRLEVGNWSGVGLLRRIAAAAARTPKREASPAVTAVPAAPPARPATLEEQDHRFGGPVPRDEVSAPRTTTLTVPPRDPAPAATVKAPTVPAAPAPIPPAPTSPSTTIRVPTTSPPPPPPPPTTAPPEPDNCGGLGHGNPCRPKKK